MLIYHIYLYVYIRGSENLHQLSENKEFIMYTQLPNVVYQ